MGFSGMKQVGDSDNTYSAFIDMQDAIAESLTVSLKERGNNWNTPGYIDVALIMNQYLFRIEEPTEKLVKVAQVVVVRLENDLNSKSGWAANGFLTDVRRLKAGLEKWLKKTGN